MNGSAWWEELVLRFNLARWWHRDCQVWGQRMAAASFDRWLYLALHRWGLMGRGECETLGAWLRPGMCVLDVGSNLGLYTVLMSRRVGPRGRVLAFEPDPRLQPVLQANCRENGCANVAVYSQALGRRAGRAQLNTLVINSGDNHLAAGGDRRLRRAVDVAVAAADDLLPDVVPDLIKIDVQGWELEVLAGMAALLARNPGVVVYFEFWPGGFRRAGYEAADLVAFLRTQGFALFRAEGGAALDDRALAELTRRLTGLKHVDLIARRPGALKAA